MSKFKTFLPLSTVILFATAFALGSSSNQKSALLKKANASRQTWKVVLVPCNNKPNPATGIGCGSGQDSACTPVNCPGMD